jgi:hypothetical protein
MLPALQAVGDIDERVHSGSTLPVAGMLQYPIGVFMFGQSVCRGKLPIQYRAMKKGKTLSFLIRRLKPRTGHPNLGISYAMRDLSLI